MHCSGTGFTQCRFFSLDIPNTPIVDSISFHKIWPSVLENSFPILLFCRITKNTSEFLCYLENQHIQQIRGADDCSLAHQATNQLWNAERPFLVVQSSFDGKVHNRVCLSRKFSSLYFCQTEPEKVFHFSEYCVFVRICGKSQNHEKTTSFWWFSMLAKKHNKKWRNLRWGGGDLLKTSKINNSMHVYVMFHTPDNLECACIRIDMVTAMTKHIWNIRTRLALLSFYQSKSRIKHPHFFNLLPMLPKQTQICCFSTNTHWATNVIVYRFNISQNGKLKQVASCGYRSERYVQTESLVHPSYIYIYIYL